MIHGHRYRAVYLLIGSSGPGDRASRMMQRAMHRGLRMLRKRLPGIRLGYGVISCDQGGPRLLERFELDGVLVVATYFERRADARRFANSLDPPPPAYGKVRTFCAD